MDTTELTSEECARIIAALSHEAREQILISLIGCVTPQFLENIINEALGND